MHATTGGAEPADGQPALGSQASGRLQSKLELACMDTWGDLLGIFYLLSAGASPNLIGDSSDRTPLSCAILAHDCGDVARVLVAAGADPNLPDGKGITPLAFCLHHHGSRPGMMAALLESGAAPDTPGFTLLSACRRPGPPNSEALQLLIEAGAEVDARDDCGSTPLLLSAQSKSLDSVAVLLLAGADASLVGQWGRTALKEVQERRAIKVLPAEQLELEELLQWAEQVQQGAQQAADFRRHLERHLAELRQKWALARQEALHQQVLEALKLERTFRSEPTLAEALGVSFPGLVEDWGPDLAAAYSTGGDTAVVRAMRMRGLHRQLSDAFWENGLWPAMTQFMNAWAHGEDAQAALERTLGQLKPVCSTDAATVRALLVAVLSTIDSQSTQRPK